MRGESIIPAGKKLSEGQVYLMFDRICKTNNQMISEGVIWEADSPDAPKMSTWDKIKTKASEIGKNLTTKVTASKLASAWKSAGLEPDSNTVADFLTKQGVNADVVNQTFADMQLPPPAAAQPAADPAATAPDSAPAADNTAPAPAANTQSAAAPATQPAAAQPAAQPAQQQAAPAGTLYSQIKAELANLDKKSKRNLAKYLEKQLGV
jgi:ribosomal protein L12E/L44/L45/RPP1/RPP2